ncbi:hypothetical protein VTO73DRAFT_7641 [Trametes versicolor]
MDSTITARQAAKLAHGVQSVEFPSPFIFKGNHIPITLVELRMRRFSGMIRAKLGWWEKVHDTELGAKWRAEMVEQDRSAVNTFWGGEGRYDYGRGEKKWPRDTITDAQLDYIFDQLKYEASQRDPTTGIFATAIPKVYESRSLVPADTKSRLIAGTLALESVPADQKDWHPGSGNQVLDLVHPSLHCLRIGHTYVRDSRSSVSGDPVTALSVDEYRAQRPDFTQYPTHIAPHVVSLQYQWLPTDFTVSEDGEVKALSYINNLHPVKHRALYPAISSVLLHFVSLFEKVLSDTVSPDPPLPIILDPYTWYSHVEDLEFPDNEVDGDDFDDYHERWERELQWPFIPDPPPFSPPNGDGRVEIELRGRTLQVIVKLANIILTPESPKYPGGSWHVEGMANEKIVATGLYYYACENITESRLDFRSVVGDGSNGLFWPYQQTDDKGYFTAYGFAGASALNQELGHIVAEEDKCVAFPNIYQHRVDAFQLADPTRPGCRKILCFFFFFWLGVSWAPASSKLI